MDSGGRHIKSLSFAALLFVLTLTLALLSNPSENGKSMATAQCETYLSAENPGLPAHVTICQIISTEINGKDGFGLSPVHIALIHHERIVGLTTLFLSKNYMENVKGKQACLIKINRFCISDELPDLS